MTHTLGPFGSEDKFDPQMTGALELGILVSMILHGVIIASSVSYYRRYVTDVMYVRVVIGVLWLLSTTHAGCLLWALYEVTILQLGEPLDFYVIPITIPLSTAFSSMMQSIVQSIFTYRLYKFSNSFWIAGFCWSLALYELVGTFTYALSFPYNTVEAQNEHHARYGWLIFSFLVCAAVLDAAIAVTIAVCLNRGRTAVMASTRRAVDELETWTLRTGVVTSFLALTIAVNFGIDWQNNIWLALYFVLTNIYPLTLMILFNGRRELMFGDHESSGGELQPDFSIHPWHLRGSNPSRQREIEEEWLGQGPLFGQGQGLVQLQLGPSVIQLRRPSAVSGGLGGGGAWGGQGGNGAGGGGGGGNGIAGDSNGIVGLTTMLNNYVHPLATAAAAVGDANTTALAVPVQGGGTTTTQSSLMVGAPVFRLGERRKEVQTYVREEISPLEVEPESEDASGGGSGRKGETKGEGDVVEVRRTYIGSGTDPPWGGRP